jgi:hypothetical protein
MANVRWDMLKEGDFFAVNLSFQSDMLLYQKIKSTGSGYNAVLLNTGDLCCVYTDNQNFEKVEVTFSCKPTE